MGDLSIPRILMWLVALGFSVMFHEIMHGWVALKLGDPTAKNDGRLTFNPKSHIDPWMTIALLIAATALALAPPIWALMQLPGGIE